MKTLMIAGLAMVTAGAALPAQAQRLVPAPMSNGQVVMGGGQVTGGWQGGGGQTMPRHYPGANYPAPQPRPPVMSPPSHGGGQWSGGHWSGGGQWSGGSNAPGGWNAYRRPTRGWSLPRYWVAPTFYISDYASFGLAVPPAGYGWSRYYDDAVLIDGRGRVWDSVNGVDWDGAGYARGGQGGYAEADDGYAYAEGGQGGYGAGYAPPPPPPARVVYGEQGGGYTSRSYSSGAGYAAGGFYYPPATTTVVTIESAPVVTTTTTEYVETYVARRRVARPVHRWRAPVRRSCTCVCGCR
ncbi:RcnB family protein [Sphingomonas sp. AR_OL41]|jgi:Ni/Co efflux regulator RcnB|uniref:RcnB family protein n=1 Tax=Sphingomonas sp. AR_OL41 TaxID=3042729 RepID=UPI002480532D|nr:RcnB family protein [Sphingomonas sp. AR_OL41]MDH7971826.1 RcnB family protein [Sphingomonas sp. AR_OL41]